MHATPSVVQFTGYWQEKQNFDANKINGNNLDLAVLFANLPCICMYVCLGVPVCVCACLCEGVGVSKRGVPNNRNEVCKVFDTCEKDVDARIEKNRKQPKKKKKKGN